MDGKLTLYRIIGAFFQATHIDVLVGDYENCFRYNYNAILADEQSMRFSPATSGKESFYFGYIVHNYRKLEDAGHLRLR
jgi:hypothetical protein